MSALSTRTQWLTAWLACMCCLLGSAHAAESMAATATLPIPDNEIALRVIDRSSAFIAATAQSDARQSRADAIETGTHEWTLTAAWQQRSVTDALLDGSTRFGEWEAGLSRGWRVLGKAGLDAAIADKERAAAANELEDAHHIAAVTLLDRWFALLSAAARSQLAQQSLQQASEQLRVAERRVQAGDAARVDLELAQSTQATAQAELLTATQALDAASKVLQFFYPELAVDSDGPRIGEPLAIDGDPEQWRNLIVSRSHEIALARAESERSALQADRAQKDRLPDPVIGVRVLNERDGTEQAVGLTLIQSFGGNARQAQATEQKALARASAALLTNVEQEIAAHAASIVGNAYNSLRVWQAQKTASDAAQQQYQRIRRGYELGEKDMTELLTSQRIALDAAQAELQARLTAHYDHARMLVDSHEIWTPDDHEHEHEHTQVTH